MKKTFRLIGLMLVCVMLTGMLSACGDDDDDDFPTEPTTHDPALVGTWVSIETEPDGSRDETTFTFKADGSFYATDIEYYPNGYTDNEWESGLWSTNEAHTRLYINVLDSYDKQNIGERDVESYSVSGTRLVIDGKVFTLQ